MRIIAGIYRRRKLLTNPGDTTRPFTDRAKESLFENIEKRVQGRRVADIFAGTGTMGLESLSRGAERVTFIEKDRIALELLKSNVATLGCERETLIWPADVLRCSYRPKGATVAEFVPWDVVFFDPPYRMVPTIVPGKPLWESVRRLAREGITSPAATLVFRVPRHATFELPDAWEMEWALKLSGMVIHICRKRELSMPEAADESAEMLDESQAAPE